MDAHDARPLSQRPYSSDIDPSRGRWARSHRNWHLSSEGPAEVGVTTVRLVLAQHDCSDDDGREFWADSEADAIARIDAMPDHGDRPGDYE